MTNYDRAREMVDEYVRENGTATEMTRKEFIEWVHARYEGVSVEKNNLLPTDICFNSYNKGLIDFPGPNLCLVYKDENQTFVLVGSDYKYSGPVYQYRGRANETIVGYWEDGSFSFKDGGEKKIISETIRKRRDYLVEWLKKDLSMVPVFISGVDDRVEIKFQELLICGISVSDEEYKIYGVSADWKEQTTYHCEKDEDDAWYYYLDTADECVPECKRLVLFEAKKGYSSNNEDSLVSDYWLDKTREVLSGIYHYGDYYDAKGKKLIKFECYGKGAKNRMQVWLNPASARNPEIVDVWVGVNVLSSDKVNSAAGEKKEWDGVECNIKFKISDRDKDMEKVYALLKDIRSMAE